MLTREKMAPGICGWTVHDDKMDEWKRRRQMWFMKGKEGKTGFYYKTTLGDWIWADTCPCEMCNKVVYEDDEGQMKGKKPTPRAMKAVKAMKRKYRRKLGPKISFKDRTRRKLNAIMADMLSPFFRPD